ncbi:hypothetical protein EDD21DRAFT_380952 [Dissophora ornata]|nr:hypothetical protein EDD21DRAFT_380952 [Dissophora ornata]
MVDVVMEQEYFGIKSHHEKYAIFDSVAAEYELTQEEDDKDIRRAGNATLRMRRRYLEHHLNRLRGPRIGYGRGEYDRVAFLPVQFNLWLKGLVRWCDGLDLRMRPAESVEEGVSRWEELVVRYRSKQVSSRNCTCSTKIHGKMNEGLGDDMEEEEEMVEVYHRECMMLESIRVDDYSNGTGGQQQQGRWRSLPLRSSSRRNRDSNVKGKKSGKTDGDRKWRIFKIAAIVFVNAILLAKVVQVIRNRATSASPSHWPTDMESYPGGTIYMDEASPQYQESQEHSNFEENRDGKGRHHHEHDNGQWHDDEHEGEKGERQHNRGHHRREDRHHRNHSRGRDWNPEGAI